MFEHIAKLTLETLFFLVEVGAVLIFVVLSVRALMGGEESANSGELKVTHLNEQLRRRAAWLKRMLMSPEEREVAARLEAKSEKSAHRQKKREAKKQLKRRPEQRSEGEAEGQEVTAPHTPEESVERAAGEVTPSAEDDAHEQVTAQVEVSEGSETPEDSLEVETSEAESGSRSEPESMKPTPEKEARARKPRLFVLKFKGDIQASAVEDLREEVTAILQIRRADDEVLLCLHNSGGYVHTHGLAASQLTRLTNAGVRLTVAIDQVAASGGYMMACVGERIIAAPFAIVGSIGVVAQVPNINRLLKRFDVDIELHTAGDYKRTLTMLGENTEEGRAKFIEELHKTHDLFQDFVRAQRPDLDVNRVATGETWYGTSAMEVGLIDEVKTSDELMLSSVNTHDIYLLEHQRKRKASERLSAWVNSLLHGQIPGM